MFGRFFENGEEKTGFSGQSWWAPDVFEGAPSPAEVDAPTMHRALKQTGGLRVAIATHMAVAEPLNTPVPPGHVRCVCVSDTHSGHNAMEPLPPGDVLIHAGDFSNVGEADDVLDFCNWVERQTQFRARVVIAGNHDLSLDKDSYPATYQRFGHRSKADTAKLVARLREVSTYLDHEVAEVCGVRIFGSPYQPEFGGWAFNMVRNDGECRRRWASMVPAYEEKPFDILVTHGPPLGHGDACIGSGAQGCWDLLDFVEAHPPKLHVFGHIHESFGVTTNGKTAFVNASTMNFNYDVRRLRKPLVFDVPVAGNAEGSDLWRGRMFDPAAAAAVPPRRGDEVSEEDDETAEAGMGTRTKPTIGA